MEYASIEREIQIDAPPEVVSRPEHIRESPSPTSSRPAGATGDGVD